MKKNLFMVGFGLLILTSVSAETIVQEGIIGEGLPVFETKRNLLQLHQESSQASKVVHVSVKVKQKIKFDLSKLITKKIVALSTTKPVTLDCATGSKDKPEQVQVTTQKNDTVDYLTPLAEGFISVRYKNKICTVDGTDNSLRGLDQRPVVEWWVRVIDSRKKPLGWLLIDGKENQVTEVDRQM